MVNTKNASLILDKETTEYVLELRPGVNQKAAQPPRYNEPLYNEDPSITNDSSAQ